jgi:hypothetical protein
MWWPSPMVAIPSRPICERRSTSGIPSASCPGAYYNRRLQKDHRNSFGRTQITTLEDLAHLCPYHHYLKTFCGYTYRGGPGTWERIPPEQYDVDLSALAKVMTVARRC